MSWDKVVVDKSEPNSLAIALFLVLSFLAFVILVGWSILFFKSEVSQVLNQKQITPITDERRDLKLYENSHLMQYKWVDKKNGRVRIPIDVAILRYINQS